MNCKDIFQDTFEELLTVRKTTIKALSESTGIFMSALYRYLHGENIPSVKNAIKIADYFSCSLDYLFGLTDECKTEIYNTVSTPNERFRSFLKDNGQTRYQVYKSTGIEQKRLSDWFYGRRTPSLACLYLVAKAYACSLDYLAGRDKI